MKTIQFPVKAIKGILLKELEDFTTHANQAIRKNCSGDVGSELIHIAKGICLKKLENCETYEDLEDYISFVGYRMSLQEWVNSL